MFMLMSGRTQVQREKAIHEPPAGSRRRRRADGGGRRQQRHAAAEGNRRADAEHGSRRDGGAERLERRAVAPADGHGDDHQRRHSHHAAVRSARRARDVHVHALVVGGDRRVRGWASASSRCSSSTSGRRASTSSRNTFPKRSICCRARSAPAMRSAPA